VAVVAYSRSVAAVIAQWAASVGRMNVTRVRWFFDKKKDAACTFRVVAVP